MKFTEVKEVPGKRYNKLQREIEEFMAMNIKIAKVEIGNHYKSPEVARSVIGVAVKRRAWPITVMRRGDEIYFVRRDM